MENIDEIKNLLQQNQCAKVTNELINNYQETIDSIGRLYKELDEKTKTDFIKNFMEKLKTNTTINNVDSINMQSYFIDNLLRNEIYDKNIYRLINNISNNNKLNEEILIEALSNCLVINNSYALDNIEVIKKGTKLNREKVGELLLKCLYRGTDIKVEIKENVFKFINKLGLDHNFIEEKTKEILNGKKLGTDNNHRNKESISKDKSLKYQLSEKAKSEYIHQKINHIQECLRDIKNIINEESEIKNQKEIDSLKNQIYILSKINNDLKNESDNLWVKIKELEEVNKELSSEKEKNTNQIEELVKNYKEAKKQLEVLEEDNKKLTNINIREANTELNIFKNKLSSRLKFYYSEFNDAKNYIDNVEDKAMCLEDHLINIFKDIKKMGVNIE